MNLGLGFLVLRDIGKRSNVMRHLAGGGEHAVDRQPLGVDVAILAPVPDDALPVVLFLQRRPERFIECPVVPPRFKDRRFLADGFVGAIAGGLRERLIHAQDDSIFVGNDHRDL